MTARMLLPIVFFAISTCDAAIENFNEMIQQEIQTQELLNQHILDDLNNSETITSLEQFRSLFRKRKKYAVAKVQIKKSGSTLARR